jgi:predicted transcriptional regulator
LQGKAAREKESNFSLRVRIGEYEVEINGRHEEVMKTIEELPGLVANVGKAFEDVRPKRVATLTVKTEASKKETKNQNYPKISPTEDCEEAIIKILHTDWGKWRPRTVDELEDALEANGQSHTARTLATALGVLVKKGTIRRWNTDSGFVYILVEKETLGVKGESR